MNLRIRFLMTLLLGAGVVFAMSANLTNDQLDRMLDVIAQRNKQSPGQKAQNIKNLQLKKMLKIQKLAMLKLSKVEFQKFRAFGRTATQINQLEKRLKVVHKKLELSKQISATNREKNESSEQILDKLLKEQTLSGWIEKCSKLKESYTAVGGNFKDDAFPLVLLNFAENKAMINAFREQYYNNMNKEGCWISNEVPGVLGELHKDIYKNTGASTVPLMPYTQKLMIRSNSCVCFMGDIHGSVHSLLRNLQTLKKREHLDDNFKVKDKEGRPFYMIFLGDYVDRGQWSVEVLHTLMRLKLANPDRVFLLKGNHEQYPINEDYGFRRELEVKYSQHEIVLMEMYNNIFEYLPSALYLGVEGEGGKKTFIQCCHGGIEPCYNPKVLLESKGDEIFDRISDTNEKLAFFKDFPPDLIDEVNKPDYALANKGVGFTWGDFFGYGGKCPILINSDRGNGTNVANEAASNYLRYLNEKVLSSSNNSVIAFFRGHQHSGYGLKICDKRPWIGEVKKSDMSPGRLGFSITQKSLQKTPIFTFSTAREGVALPYDCYGILTVGKKPEDFRLQPYEWHLKEDELGLKDDWHHDARDNDNIEVPIYD